MKKIFTICAIILAGLIGEGCSTHDIPSEKTLTKEMLFDKIRGGWAGKVIGCTYGDGWYGGVYVAAMYSLAFICDDVQFIVEKALEAIPTESRFHRCIADVIAWHRKYPDNWEISWALCEKTDYALIFILATPSVLNRRAVYPA